MAHSSTEEAFQFLKINSEMWPGSVNAANINPEKAISEDRNWNTLIYKCMANSEWKTLKNRKY
jgi:hypothetical protein